MDGLEYFNTIWIAQVIGLFTCVDTRAALLGAPTPWSSWKPTWRVVHCSLGQGAKSDRCDKSSALLRLLVNDWLEHQ